MAIINTTWNGYEVIGEKYTIKNIGNNDARIKKIYLDNVNQYLLGNTSYTPIQGFIFYQNLYPFKFYNDPIFSNGVVVSNLDVSFYLSGTQIPVYETPPIQNYLGYPGPMSVSNVLSSTTQYLTGEGITVVNPNQFIGTSINLYNRPLKDTYRANKTYTLRTYGVNGNEDELEIFIIFTPNMQMFGLYEADLVIEYEDPQGVIFTRKNTLKCLLKNNTNISEIDKTPEINVFSIDNIQLEGNEIFIS
tara:strand:- start:2396 stop:3136 length:741 start_codon:yes stop_codon:yes gene_type:complete